MLKRAFWDGFVEGYILASTVTSPAWVLLLLKWAIWDGFAIALPCAFAWSFAGIYGMNVLARAAARRRVVRWSIDLPTVGPAQ